MNLPKKPDELTPDGAADGESGRHADAGQSRLRVVGIGASAGGLAALEAFFTVMPADSGLAFIVVQHLDPTHKALLPDLLQRLTSMSVHDAESRMRIEPDCIYVIPPNTELSIEQQRLKVVPPTEPRGRRLPVDVLFSSLASGYGEAAAAIVLSGMGSDGTVGLQAIKAMGGLTLAETPEAAEFDSMPKSAIDSGNVDIVASADELPARLMALIAGVGTGDDDDDVDGTPPAESPQASNESALEQIATSLRERTQHDFSQYKPSTLQRRSERRMGIHGIETLSAYAGFLRENATEIDLLFKELLIGVTAFFRDPDVWDVLAEHVLPSMLADLKGEHCLRAWVVGCSTGEEAYSLAMVFSEVVARLGREHELSLQIFGSDLSSDAIALARVGHYPETIRDQVSEARLARHFVATPNGFKVSDSIRGMVLFARHDVALDPPFTRLDLLFCRNLLIYFDAALQRRLIPLFHYSVRQGGLLLLGSSETVGRFQNLFASLHAKLRLYRRLPSQSRGGPNFMLQSLPTVKRAVQESAVSSSRTPQPSADRLKLAADDVLLQVYAPAAVLLSRDGDVVYVSGRTGKYLEPAAGKANWNIHAMAREGLRAPLVAALKDIAGQTEPVHLNGLRVATAAGEQQVNVVVQALERPPVLNGMTMVVFRDVAAPTAPAPSAPGDGPQSRDTQSAQDVELDQCRHEIDALRAEVRATKDDLQVSNEESEAANEELQSTNEELQSANEELTTSKEEMQSMNEELQTINSELQSKLDDLAMAQSDMRNVLNSIEIAILFLDQKLNVRRFTDRAAGIINLRDSDIGRPLSDLTTSLDYPDLHEDAAETLRSLVTVQKEVTASDDRWFMVRIMPYRRVDNFIDGAVITLLDITRTKELEASLRRQAAP